MNIENLRKKNEISQKDLAKRLEISQSALCYYEKGLRNVPLKILLKLTEIFNCSLDELVRGSEK